MTEEIKNRIESIRKGEVPNGYSEGVAGILPNDWTSKPLSEISEVISEQAGDDDYETLSISAGIGFVNQAQKFGKELSGKQYEKYTVLRKGDFAYNKGNSKLYPQGCTYRLKERDEAAVPNVFECFRITEGCPEYYEQLFISGFMNRQLTRKINHGVRDDGLLNLTDADFYSTVLPVPPLAEQQKIAEILSSIDKIIKQYECQKESLMRFKHSLTKRLFPNEKSTVPEIRFKVFSGAWKKDRLEDISERVIVGLATSVTPHYRETGVPILRNLNIKSNYLDDTDLLYLDPVYAASQKNKQIHTGDVITVHTGYIGISCVVPPKYNNCLTFTTLITTPKKDMINSDYLSQYLNSEQGLNSIMALTTQGGRQNLNTGDFVNAPIIYPSLAEQVAISNTLKQIDDEITLVLKMIEERKTQKNAICNLLLTGLVRV